MMTRTPLYSSGCPLHRSLPLSLDSDFQTIADAVRASSSLHRLCRPQPPHLFEIGQLWRSGVKAGFLSRDGHPVSLRKAIPLSPSEQGEQAAPLGHGSYNRAATAVAAVLVPSSAARRSTALAGASVSRPPIASGGVRSLATLEAEEAQDSQIILCDPRRRIAYEANSAGGEVRLANNSPSPS